MSVSRDRKARFFFEKEAVIGDINIWVGCSGKGRFIESRYEGGKYRTQF